MFSIIGMIFLIVVIINQMPVLYFIIPLSIIGIVQGYGFSPLTNLGMYNVNKENNGMASGLVNFSHQIGASSGIVIELILANAFINILALKDNVNTFTVLTVVVGLLIFIIMFIAVIGLQLKMRNLKD
ncbi:hypothetical protein BUZ08_09490 [Staphylococcus gallinarum]|uniref:hypothetical protein n=1 Tax=Staphylococcus gallinarum TaxID=1293 RepID=UPI000D1DA401|nr:hypothetical protein [Staphylococcus gallinarum]MCD8785556.1 hypothetical protein [Staphylococcus gallinarum]MCD8858260.1 hypothetical protein [Staphylococcus gallinarum]PTL16799.1 hypothetical protein BUZ08_09490 [Staphylococcus gallinarum]RIO78103.1 hypothetical protein BUZ07_10865 [Staphylococcus gallinarum]